MNILVGNIETPEQTFLVDCSIIETANQATVSTKIDNCLLSLQVPQENFALFLLDVTSYMRACSTTLKVVLYPNLFHVFLPCSIWCTTALKKSRATLLMWTTWLRESRQSKWRIKQEQLCLQGLAVLLNP